MAYMTEKKNTHRVIAAHHVGRTPLGRFRSRWKDNINMDIKTAGRAWTGLI
jgi:hypothetical protein